jgi:hypothetical protein
MIWSGGTQSGSSGTTDILSTAELDIEGSAVKTLTNRTINNAGTTTWSGDGAIEAGDGSTFNNQIAALFYLQGATSWLDSSSSSVLNNAGLLQKRGPEGTSVFEGQFNNSGQVSVQVASLALHGGGTLSGEFDITSTEARLDLIRGVWTDIGTLFDGLGTLQLGGDPGLQQSDYLIARQSGDERLGPTPTRIPSWDPGSLRQ